jgi:hypothetical protein
MATYSDLVIDQGSYFSTTANAGVTGVFDTDLTGYTARGTIRKSYSSTTYYPFAIAIPEPTNGKVELSLSSEVTGSIKAGRYLYDVEIIRTSDEQVTRIQEGQIEIMPGATSSAYDAGNAAGTLTRDRLVRGLKKAILGADGKLTVPGAITSSGDPVSAWSASITAIELGSETLITLSTNVFVAPTVGQVIISDVQGTTQANGTWYYLSWNVNQFKIYSDSNAQTAVDSTDWDAYTTGGTALNQSPPGVMLTAGSFSWNFDSSGELTLPTGGRLGFVGKGWTGLDGGNGNSVSVFSYYPNGNFSSCITPYSYGSVGVTTYTDGAGVGGEWYFNVDGSLTFPNKPTNTRTGNGPAMLFAKDNNQKIIATQAGTQSQPTVERLVIAGGDGFDNGEGGDIYLWAGRSGSAGGSGGDIKVDAGDSYSSPGGSIKIRGGNGYAGENPSTSSGGFVQIQAGDSWNGGDGADLTLTAGNSYNVAGGTNGKVTVSTGQGAYIWNFNRDGDLQLPTNGGILFDRANTSIRVGQGFHIASGEGVSIDSINQDDQTTPITRRWHFDTDGKIHAPLDNVFYARAAITLINFPAQDSGFGLTTPDGVTHDFTYDYDGTHGPETPILIALGTDTIQNVADKTIAVLNYSGLFGEVHWDQSNNCIWVYQNVAGAIGNQTNQNYSYGDGVSSFINGDGAAIVFGDNTSQTTAYKGDLIHSWTFNNQPWEIKQYNGSFSGSYAYGNDPLLWWDAANIPGLADVNHFRGAVIEFHAYVNGKTVIGTVWISSDSPNAGDLTKVANAHSVFAGNQNDFTDMHFDVPWNSNNPSGDETSYMSHQLGYYNAALTSGQDDILVVMWTSRVFIGRDYYGE